MTCMQNNNLKLTRYHSASLKTWGGMYKWPVAGPFGLKLAPSQQSGKQSNIDVKYCFPLRCILLRY
jgi:hypothetical protein